MAGPGPSGDEDAGSRSMTGIYPTLTWPTADTAHMALLVIDLQVLCAAPGSGMFAAAERLGVPELLRDYRTRLETLVIPNVARLMAAARLQNVPVISTRIRSATADGSDRVGCHVALGIHVAPDDPDGDFIEAVTPADGEAIIDKTTSDAFIGTDLESLLSELGRDQLVVAGVLTHECVESTVRHAADLGLAVTVVENACAAVEQDRHLASIRNMGLSYARIRSTDDVLADLGEHVRGTEGG